MSQEFHALTVASVSQASPDARVFELSVPADLVDRFRFTAGQYVTLELPWDGFAIRRCYSLCAAPGDGRSLRFAVKRVAGGRASNWLNEKLGAGESLRVAPPEGRFVLHDDDAARPLILFAGGSGITPVLSLMDAALRDTEREVTLFYANRDAAAVMFQAEIESLRVAYPGRLSVVHHLDSQSGLVTPEALAREVEGRSAGSFYVCGPTPFMDAVEDTLVRAGIEPGQMHFERFVSPVDPDRQSPEERVSQLGSVDIASFALTLDGREHQVPYAQGQTLLQAARAAGLNVPSSCESGYCGSCMAQCESGEVAMASHEALDARSLDRGRILLCQSKPQSDAPLRVSCDETSFRRAPAAQSGGALWLRRAVGFGVAAFVFVAVWVLRTRG